MPSCYRRSVPGKPPKKITRPRLRNVAVAYLQRFGGSEARLRQVLERRVARSLRHHEELDRTDEVRAWIDEVVQELSAAGLCDDRKHAHVAAVQQSLSGRPLRVIRMRLRQKGFSADAIDAALRALRPGEEHDPDWVACCRYARRRGLGPFRRPGAKERGRERELGSLMRAGFRYEHARRVLDAESAVELQDAIDEAPLPRATPEPED